MYISHHNNNKYTFSGHESFPCKTLWLKKGYDFVKAEKDFNAPEAVVDLGVGKNMVAVVRYWQKAFGLNKDAENGWIADYSELKAKISAILSGNSNAEICALLEILNKKLKR